VGNIKEFKSEKNSKKLHLLFNPFAVKYIIWENMQVFGIITLVPLFD